MSIILLLVVLAVVMALVPMDPTIRNIIIAIVLVFAIVWLFRVLGSGSLHLP